MVTVEEVLVARCVTAEPEKELKNALATPKNANSVTRMRSILPSTAAIR